MKGSIKTKLILALTVVITGALILSGAIIIYQNTQDMRRDIFLDALTFSELTNDKIVISFEQFYVSDNFLQFRKDVNPLLGKNVDVNRIEILGKSGELFYDSVEEGEVAYVDVEERRHEYDIDRTRNIKPSLLFANGDLVYVKKSAEGEWLAVNANDELIDFPDGEVINVVYPHVNARLSLGYTLSYEALRERIIAMIISIAAVLVLSIALVSGFAIYLAGKLVRPIKILEKGVIKVGEGAYGTQVRVVSDDEIGLLAGTFNRMSRKLKKDTEELLIKEAIEKELSIAGEIQQNMLPKTSPVFKNIDISGSLTPAEAIGGDIYDYLEVDAEQSYIFIADVTGHGVPAGMVAGVAHSTLYSFAKVYKETDKIMGAMNAIVHAKTKSNMFATALLLHWEEKTRIIKFCNAGHEEMVHYDAEKKEVSLIGKGGMALGMLPDTTKIMIEQQVVVKKDDVLILYTDGIPEAWATEKDNLGMEGFVKIVEKVIPNNPSAKGLREAILREVTTFRNNYPQQDDITLIVLKGK